MRCGRPPGRAAGREVGGGRRQHRSFLSVSSSSFPATSLESTLRDIQSLREVEGGLGCRPTCVTGPLTYLYRATAKKVGSVWLCTHTRSLKGDSGLGWVLNALGHSRGRGQERPEKNAEEKQGVRQQVLPPSLYTPHSHLPQALPSRAESLSVSLETEASTNSSSHQLAFTPTPGHVPGNKAPWKLFHP